MKHDKESPGDTEHFHMTIGSNDEGRRVDRILRKAFPGFSLSFIHQILRKKRVLVNGKPVKADDRVIEGDGLSLKGPIAVPRKDTPCPEYPPLPKPDILYAGSGLLIVLKPAGLAVHGPDSLETRVNAYLQDTLPASLSFKPGPLHRLDKPTSGIVAFSTSLDGAKRFSQALREGTVKKYYLALMDGVIDTTETWEDHLYRDESIQKTLDASLPGTPAGPARQNGNGPERPGQRAVMTVRPLARNERYSLVWINLETGRTHQIRAQGAIHGHPLAGDKKYGGSFLAGGYLLHARAMAVPEETAPDLPRLMLAPLPEGFEKTVIRIFGGKIKGILSEIPPSLRS